MYVVCINAQFLAKEVDENHPLWGIVSNPCCYYVFGLTRMKNHSRVWGTKIPLYTIASYGKI